MPVAKEAELTSGPFLPASAQKYETATSHFAIKTTSFPKSIREERAVTQRIHTSGVCGGLCRFRLSETSSFLNMVQTLCLSSPKGRILQILWTYPFEKPKKQISSSPSFCHRQIVLYTASSGVFRHSLSKSNEVSIQARGIIIYCQRRLSSLKAIVTKIADDWYWWQWWLLLQ